MATFPVIGVRCHGAKDDDAIVLGQVVSSKAKPLDVRFVATEGEHPYVIQLKHDRISKLREDADACSNDEWEHILTCALLKDQPVDGVEAVAKVKSGESIEILFTKKVSGIVTGRLGTLALKCKEDQEISIFSWCAQLKAHQQRTRNEQKKERESHSSYAARIEELESLLEELRVSSKAAQDDLANAFAQILNEKKLRLRQQERLLSTAKVDPVKLAVLKASRPIAPQHNAQKSRPGKRKANEEPKPDSDQQLSPDDFESMPDRGRKGSRLRYGSPSSTSSEGEEDDEEELPARTTRATAKPAKRKGKDLGAAATRTNSKPPSSPEPKEEPSSASAPAQDGSETESGSDDELR